MEADKFDGVCVERLKRRKTSKLVEWLGSMVPILHIDRCFLFGFDDLMSDQSELNFRT